MTGDGMCRTKREAGGMGRCALWFLMLEKKIWRKPLFLGTILLIPVFVLALSGMRGEESILQVALFVSEEAPESFRSLAQELEESSSHVVRFYREDSPEKVRRAVETDVVECGYILKDSPRIICLQKEQSFRVKMVNEVVYSKMYPSLAYDIMEEFLQDHVPGLELDGEEEEWLRGRYEEYRDMPSVFHFEYMDGSENAILNDEESSYLVLPVRGMIGVLIFLAGLSGAMFWYQDREKGIFNQLEPQVQPLLVFPYIMVPLANAGLLGLAGILASGIAENILRESILLLAYFVLLTGYCCLLCQLVPRLSGLLAVLPILIPACLIFCPVFVDLSSVSGIAAIRRFLPPAYYLEGLHQKQTVLGMMIAGVIFSMAGMGVWHIKKKRVF